MGYEREMLAELMMVMELVSGMTAHWNAPLQVRRMLCSWVWGALLSQFGGTFRQAGACRSICWDASRNWVVGCAMCPRVASPAIALRTAGYTHGYCSGHAVPHAFFDTISTPESVLRQIAVGETRGF